MPIFTIQTPSGRTLEIEAPDEAQALAGAEQWQAEQSQAAPAGAPPAGPNLPAGMPAPGAAQDPNAPAPEAPGLARQIFDAMFPRYGVAASVANGMTFGTLPNIQAGTKAGANAVLNAIGLGDGRAIGETYDRTLAEQQDARRRFEAEHPFLNPVLNAAGGFATGVGLAREGATLVGRETLPVLGRMTGSGAGQTAKRAAAGAVEGAGYGAAAGFGGGEGGFENRAKAAGDNLAVGAALGAAAPVAVDLASRAGGAVRDVVRSVRNPEGRADDWLVRRIMQDRTSPDEIATAVQQAAAAGQPEFMAVDAAGRNTQKLAKAASRAPGSFRDEAFGRLNARQEGQATRLGQFSDEALGQTGVGAFNTEQGIVNARRTASQRHYDEAYSAPAPSGQFYDEMLDRQSVQDALRTVERTAAENQLPLTEVFAEIPNPNARTVTRQVPTSVLGPDGQPIMRTETELENPTLRVPTMRGWDMIKRALDTQVNTAFGSVDPAQRSLAQAVRETRDQLRQRLADDNPAYGQALKRYADDTTALEAIQTGRDLAKARNADEAGLAFRQMTPGEQDLARAGAAREIGVKLENQPVGNDKTRIFSTPNMEQKIELLSPDPTIRAIFGERVARERTMASTRRGITGGSDTAENLGEAVDLPGATALARLAEGRLLSAIFHGTAGAAAGAGRAATGMTEPVAQRVGSYLTSTDPAEIRALGDLFAAAQSRAQAPAVGTAGTIAAIEAPRQRSGRRSSITDLYSR
ncbi:hypothetical protein [Enterovirga sp. CN4-39]|uniref:hypothetical protein n=1 Tax=Enterovirga sp. CN4-39 TaxID=3400910 RepID=UPI003C106A66